MFYLASDNPLAPGAIAHLKAIKNAGYHPEVNVLAQFDPHPPNVPVHIFDVNRIEKLKHPNKANVGFTSNDPFVRNLITDKLWTAEVNEKIKKALKKRKIDIPFDPPLPLEKMCDEFPPKDSLDLFLQFCQEHYPARHYMLFIVGHGVIVGNDVFLHDENVGTTRQGNSHPSSLSLIGLADLLKGFKERSNGHQLEMIGFHACSMRGVEVAFELKGLANYMLAAQGPTYNGAWPYRQILIHLFNNLNSGKRFIQEEIRADGLVDLLKRGKDPFSKFFRDRFNGNGTRKLWDEHEIGKQPAEELVGVLTNELNALLTYPKLSKEFRHRKLPAMRKDHNLRRFNRQLILSALPQFNVRGLCKKIFNYCLFNSFDFQLAGYSSDLTLCDLNKVGDLQEPIFNLVDSLRKGMSFSKEPNDSLVRELMVWAHLEAQSFFQEQYTDLYDFCFRLRAKCKSELTKMPSSQTQDVLEKIRDACEAVMRVLKRGKHKDDNGVIVRSDFCGSAYQYTHGLSVFFPWSEPVANPMWEKHYSKYAFKKATRWDFFLQDYFAGTMRKPEGDEGNDVEEIVFVEDLDRDLLQAMASQVFNDAEQLGSSGSKDPMGSVATRDPQGDGCNCPSRKNYPSCTHSETPTASNKQAINMAKAVNKSYTVK